MNNREAATFILLGAAFVWMLWQPAVRASMRGVAMRFPPDRGGISYKE